MGVKQESVGGHVLQQGKDWAKEFMDKMYVLLVE